MPITVAGQWRILTAFPSIPRLQSVIDRVRAGEEKVKDEVNTPRVVRQFERAGQSFGRCGLPERVGIDFSILVIVCSSLLIRHIKRGDLMAVGKALSEGADPSEEDTQGWTPLFHAAAEGNLAILKLLIDVGADVNHGAQNGFTALYSAVLSGHLEIVRELLRAGAMPVPVDTTPLRGYAPSAEIRALLGISN